jgi:hypothetical protein
MMMMTMTMTTMMTTTIPSGTSSRMPLGGRWANHPISPARATFRLLE